MGSSRFSTRAAVCLAAVLLVFAFASPAHAATFTPTPAAGATVTAVPAQLSVLAVDTVALNTGTRTFSVDGVARTASVTYYLVSPAYYDDEDEYWVNAVYDYKRATITCAPGVLADGQHTATLTISAGTSPKTFTWTFGVSEKPVLGAVTPAAGTTTPSTTPLITAAATDNSGITAYSGTVDGTTVPCSLAAGVLTLAPASPLANQQSHTAAVSVSDAAGNTTTKSWTFTVNGPVTTWSGEVPAKGAALTVAPRVISADARCTVTLVSSTRKVVFDGVAVATNWLNPYPSDLTRATILAYPATMGADGTHTVAVTVGNTSGATATDSWSYTVAIPPTLGTPSPAPNSSVSTTTPAITLPASDNTAVGLVTALVNGSAAPAAFDTATGKVRVTLLSPLPDDAITTVTVCVTDTFGLHTDKTWSFEVQSRPVMAGDANDCDDCHAGIGADPDMSPACDACHDEHQGTTASYHTKADVSACKPCHVSSLIIEHNRPGITCVTCHDSTDPAVKAAIRSGDSRCQSCHPNADHESLHTTTVSPACAGAGCHSGTSLTNVHTGTCDSCHKSVDPNVIDAIAGHDTTCEACHPNANHAAEHASAGGTEWIATGIATDEYHSGSDGGDMECSACHGATDNLLTRHASECPLCHSSAASQTVKDAIARHDTSCEACHPEQHVGPNDSHQQMADGSVSGCTCHWLTGDWQEPPQTDCTECHPATPVVATPVTTSDALAIYHSDAVIKLTATDGFEGSLGIKATYYELDGAEAAAGTQIAVAAPSNGTAPHTLRFWSTDWSGNTESAHTVLFTMSVVPLTLTYSAGAGGTISGTSPQTVSYNSNGTAVSAVPTTGYHFVNWSDGSAANPRTDSHVTADKSVTANFAINTFTLTYSASPGGTISGTSPQTVSYNTSGTAVGAVPNTGYHFVNWSDGSAANPRTDSNVTASKSVTANFAINVYTLTYTAGAGGTINGTSPQTVNHNGSGTAVTAVPTNGYHFVNWSDGSVANPRTDTSVTANKSVTANFAAIPITYTLTYTAGAGGSISGSSPQTVESGGSGTAVVAVPTNGYHFVNWSDGVATASRTDANVTANMSVTANFAAGTSNATLSFTSSGNLGHIRLHVEDANGNVIASSGLLSSGVYDWSVVVPAGQDYLLWVEEGFDYDANMDFGNYGIWSSDTSINPDGVLSPGETVTWSY